MSTYSSRFIAGEVTSSSLPSFSCPAGSVCVVRDVEYWNNGSSSCLIYVGLYVSGSLVGVFAAQSALAVNTAFQWEGRVVMNPGDEIKVNIGPGQCMAVISGYNLIG